MVSLRLMISAVVLVSACAPQSKFKSGAGQGSPSALSSEDATPVSQATPEVAKNDVDYGTGVSSCVEGDKIILLTETLKADAAAGAKLISCGQSADGNRIAVQWVKLTNSPTQSCNTIQQGAGITTGCYTHYVDAAPPPPAKTDEERRQRVYACLGSI